MSPKESSIRAGQGGEEVELGLIRMNGGKWLNHCCARFWRCFCFGDYMSKTYSFYDHLEERIESDLDIVDIVKKMRYMQIMLNSTHLNSIDEKDRFDEHLNHQILN